MTPRRDELSEHHVGRVYRALADEHASRTAKLREEDTWRRISEKAMSSRPKWRLLEGFRRWTASLAVVSTGRLAGAFAGAVLLGVVLVWWGASAENLGDSAEFTLEVDGATVSSRWIHAEADPVGVRFSDGSAVRLQANSQVAVTLAGDRQARLRVAEGALTAHVVHAEGADWRFSAGPYEVKVVGTKFDLAWDGGLLKLQMHEGKVEVSGPNNARWTVSGTERLELGSKLAGSSERAEGHDLPGADPDPAQVLAPPEQPIKERRSASKTGQDREPSVARESAKEVSSLTAPINESSKGQAHTGAAPTSRPSWSEMLAEGRFTAILSEATEQGLEHALAARSASELSALAQAARYAKHPAVSERAWTALQRRYPTSSMAKEAGFFLARVAEQRGQAGAAQRQYRTYLDDGGAGRYSGEALGGLMRLLRTAEPAEAARFARRYLKGFPNGPYTRLARELVEKSSLGK